MKRTMAMVAHGQAVFVVTPPPLARCIGKQMVKDTACALASYAGEVAQPDMVAQFPCIRLGVVFLLYAEEWAQLGDHAGSSADLAIVSSAW